MVLIMLNKSQMEKKKHIWFHSYVDYLKIKQTKANKSKYGYRENRLWLPEAKELGERQDG